MYVAPNTQQVVVIVKGKSGSGKTTIARVIEQALIQKGMVCMVVDDNGQDGEIEATPDNSTLETRIRSMQGAPRTVVVKTRKI